MVKKKRDKNKKYPIRKFKGFFGKLEIFTEKSIPFWLIILTVLLILDNPFWTILSLHEYNPWVTIIDGLIVLFFVIDLFFKWLKIKHWKPFVKLYWLDLLAVFPFYLISSTFISIKSLLAVGEEIGEGQRVLHEFLLLREGELVKEARLIKETELLKESRPIMRAIRSVQRFMRFVAGYELEKGEKITDKK